MFLLHYFLVTELKEFWCVPGITAQASVLHNRVQSRVHSGAAPLPLHMPHLIYFCQKMNMVLSYPRQNNGIYVLHVWRSF